MVAYEYFENSREYWVMIWEKGVPPWVWLMRMSNVLYSLLTVNWASKYYHKSLVSVWTMQYSHYHTWCARQMQTVYKARSTLRNSRTKRTACRSITKFHRLDWMMWPRQRQTDKTKGHKMKTMKIAFFDSWELIYCKFMHPATWIILCRDTWSCFGKNSHGCLLYTSRCV